MSPWGAAFFLVPITSKRWPAKLAVCLVRFFFSGSESKSYSDAKNGTEGKQKTMERGRGDVMKHKRKNTPKQPSGGVTRSIFAGWYSTITARAEQQKLAKATQTDIS